MEKLEKVTIGAQLVAAEEVAAFLQQFPVDECLREELALYRTNRTGIFRVGDVRFRKRQDAVVVQLGAVPDELRRAVATKSFLIMHDEAFTLLVSLGDRERVSDALDDVEIILEFLAKEGLLVESSSKGQAPVLETLRTELDLLQYANYHYLKGLQNRIQAQRGRNIAYLGHHIQVPDVRFERWPSRTPSGIVPLPELSDEE